MRDRVIKETNKKEEGKKMMKRMTARMIARSVISQVSTNVPGKPKQAKYSFMGYSPPMSDF